MVGRAFVTIKAAQKAHMYVQRKMWRPLSSEFSASKSKRNLSPHNKRTILTKQLIVHCWTACRWQPNNTRGWGVWDFTASRQETSAVDHFSRNCCYLLFAFDCLDWSALRRLQSTNAFAVILKDLSAHRKDLARLLIMHFKSRRFR